MPEHFHGIIYVTGYMQEHLGDVVRLFKSRVAMSYRQLLAEDTITAVGMAKEWQAAYQALSATQQATTRQWIEEQLASLYSATRCGTQGTQSPLKVVSSGHHSKVGFLFATGYTDSLLLDEDNLQGHRLYIRNNPHSRWMRTHNRQLLMTNREGINTAVSLSALTGYLRRECPAQDVTDAKLALVQGWLLYSATRCGTQGTQGQGTPSTQGASQPCTQGASQSGAAQPGVTTQEWIECQSYGDRALLQRPLLPIVCHRKDAARFNLQKERCLQEAGNGAVMVSACISPKEREIMEAVMEAGYPVIRIKDNGFPELYHPSQKDIDLCASSQLLILTPWQYHYQHKDDAIFVAYCKTMNCIAQAICRRKDSWWKE